MRTHCDPHRQAKGMTQDGLVMLWCWWDIQQSLQPHVVSSPGHHKPFPLAAMGKLCFHLLEVMLEEVSLLFSPMATGPGVSIPVGPVPGEELAQCWLMTKSTARLSLPLEQ